MSVFGQKRHSPRASSPPAVEETYDLKGLNLISPDEIMPPGESPWTINSRMRARNEGESRVANRTRKGAGVLSVAVGETANVSNVAVTTGNIPFTTTTAIAQAFTPNATGALTRLDLDIKKPAGTAGHVIVEIYTDKTGFPGTMIAQGSILSNVLLTTYAFNPAYFIDAPTLTSGTQYWFVVYLQDNGTGPYYLNQQAVTVAAYSSPAQGQYNVLTGSAHYKTYLSSTGTVTGYTLRKPSNFVNRVIFTQATNMYAFDETVGTPTLIDSGQSVSATYTRFEQIDDKTIYANGFDQLHWYDGTTSVPVPNVPNATPSGVIAWKNRLFVWSGTRCDFSELLAYTTWPSVNFFYVPSPKSPDLISGTIVFHDNLVFLTHTTKHIIIGSDISNFTRKEAVGTKGAYSQEAIAVDKNFVYFMSDDGQIYRWNGVSDQLLSENVQTELQGVDPKTVRFSIYRNQLRVYYAKLPSSTPNRTLIYDTILNQWFLDTEHPVIGAMVSADKLIEFSPFVGRAYYGEAQYSDLGKKINWKYWTNYKTYGYRRRTGQSFGGASSKKRIKRFRPILRAQTAPYTMLVGKDMDFNNVPDMRPYTVSATGQTWGGGATWGGGKTWGSTRNVQARAPMSGRGWHIQYRFERNGVETPVELYGYVSQYRIGRQK